MPHSTLVNYSTSHYTEYLLKPPTSSAEQPGWIKSSWNNTNIYVYLGSTTNP